MSKNDNQPVAELGRLINSRRQEIGLSLEDLAKAMGMTLEQTKKLEVRKCPSLAYNMVKSLARALQLEPSILVKFVGITCKSSQSQLGQCLRNRRKELGISGIELARRFKVSKQLISQIELGKSSLSQSKEMVTQLAKVLDLDIKALQAFRPKHKKIFTKRADSNPLGGFLTKRRLELDLTQREVSELIGEYYGFVSHIERGSIPLSLERLKKFETVLQCKIPVELTSEG